MSSAFKCDRCGELEEGNATFTVWEDYEQAMKGQEWCGDCQEEFEDFVKGNVRDGRVISNKKSMTERFQNE